MKKENPKKETLDCDDEVERGEYFFLLSCLSFLHLIDGWMLNDEINCVKLSFPGKSKKPANKGASIGFNKTFKATSQQQRTHLLHEESRKNGSQTGAVENKKCLQLLMDSILLQIVFFSSASPPPGSIYMQIFHPASTATIRRLHRWNRNGEKSA